MIKKLFNKLFGDNHPDIISFAEGYHLTELPLITLFQGDKKFNFLLDTGSNNSIIDKNILDQIEHTNIDAKSNLFGLEGVSKEVPICSITLSHKGKDYKYEYLVCDMKAPFDSIKKDSGVNLHGIIGSKFFNTYKYVLDFADLIAYSKV